MKLCNLGVFSAAFLLASPTFAHRDHHKKPDVLRVLYDLGLTKFADLLAERDPNLVATIGQRNDITIWAPGNDAVVNSPFFNLNLHKRQSTSNVLKTCVSTDYGKGTGKSNLSKREESEFVKRTYNDPDRFSRNSPNSNFMKIFTFLTDPDAVNLGPGQELRLVRNYASPSDGRVDSPAVVEVTSGLGNVQNTLRGPFRFKNGVIYEVSNFFTLPQSFKETTQQVGLANQFLNLVESSGSLSLFETSPAVTIFAPVDSFGKIDVDPRSHIIFDANRFSLYLSPDLNPGETLTAVSGAQIKITRSPTGEPLVNCRRLVKQNVIIKNGVIHFIDGPLHGHGNSCS